jgi:hypothetical protein
MHIHLILGGQLFLDDKFGNIISSIGRRSIVPKTILSDKYDELTARFKSNIYHLYENLFLMTRDTFLSLQYGEHDLADNIRAFYDRIRNINEQLDQWASEMKYQLEIFAQTISGDWTRAFQQYSQNTDIIATTMRTMFQQLTQDLLKNYLDIATQLIPDALLTIENMKQQGFLGFLSH